MTAKIDQLRAGLSSVCPHEVLTKRAEPRAEANTLAAASSDTVCSVDSGVEYSVGTNVAVSDAGTAVASSQPQPLSLKQFCPPIFRDKGQDQ